MNANIFFHGYNSVPPNYHSIVPYQSCWISTVMSRTKRMSKTSTSFKLISVNGKIWLQWSCDHAIINIQGKSIFATYERMGFFEKRGLLYILMLSVPLILNEAFNETGCCGESTDGSCSVCSIFQNFIFNAIMMINNSEGFFSSFYSSGMLQQLLLYRQHMSRLVWIDFISLYVCCFSSLLEFFFTYMEVTIARNGLHI